MLSLESVVAYPGELGHPWAPTVSQALSHFSTHAARDRATSAGAKLEPHYKALLSGMPALGLSVFEGTSCWWF